MKSSVGSSAGTKTLARSRTVLPVPGSPTRSNNFLFSFKIRCCFHSKSVKIRKRGRKSCLVRPKFMILWLLSKVQNGMHGNFIFLPQKLPRRFEKKEPKDRYNIIIFQCIPNMEGKSLTACFFLRLLANCTILLKCTFHNFETFKNQITACVL